MTETLGKLLCGSGGVTTDPNRWWSDAEKTTNLADGGAIRVSHASSGVRQAQAVRHGRGLDAPSDGELGEDPRDVHAGRLLAHEQLRADLPVRAARGHEQQHLELARGQAQLS